MSGGIPKYLEWLLNAGETPFEKLISASSPLIEEGLHRLVEDFGSEHRAYFSIRAAIAKGHTSRARIESYLDMGVGPALENLFIAQLKHSGQFNRIGSYWDNKGEHEIDIVAINDLEKRLLVVEVKRQSKRFKPEQLAAKTEQLLQKLNCPGYSLEQRCFALDNLEQVFSEFS